MADLFSRLPQMTPDLRVLDMSFCFVVSLAFAAHLPKLQELRADYLGATPESDSLESITELYAMQDIAVWPHALWAAVLCCIHCMRVCVSVWLILS